MYDELIRSCRACATGYVGNCDNCMFSGKDCYKQLHKASADAIEELSKPRWIPVTERLPEIDEKHHCSKDVLAYLKDGGMCFTALEENIFGQACFECERNPDFEEEMIVTHWMPLPEPPKEEH